VRSDIPVTADRKDNLYAPVPYDGGERGKNWTGRTKGTSLYTKAVLHPQVTAAAAAAAALGVGLAAAAVLGRRAASRAERDAGGASAAALASESHNASRYESAAPPTAHATAEAAALPSPEEPLMP
jgi:hypothetical protein